ncbi:MAG: histidine phosphatase family protein [Nitriliruptoraceae bacterium]
MKRLILLRHGESHWNAEGRIQGQSCAGLSGRGQEQARATARSFGAHYPGALIAASDLQRTVETAEPIAEAVGGNIKQDERLRERHFGAWEGRLRRDVIEEDANRWQRFARGDEVMGEIGGETTPQLVDRCLPALRGWFDEMPDDETTIIVTHGGTIWHGTHALLRLPVPSLGMVHNAAAMHLVAFDDRIWIERWNDQSHLPEPLRT